MKKGKSNFIVQGGILAAAGIIARIMGIARRVAIQHIIGDVGNGYYSVAYEIYNMMLMISCYSLPLAVSKVVAAKIGKRQYQNANRAFQCAMGFALGVGGLVFLITEVFADVFASELMLEPMSALALKVLAPALLIVAVMGVFRGYFQGLGTMMPTAVSQIVEQIFVVGGSIVGAYLLYRHGEKVGALLHNENYAPSYGAAGASVGPVLGAAIGLIFLLFVYYSYRGRFTSQVKKDTVSPDSYRTMLRLIVLTVLPVLLSTTVYNLSNILDIRIYNSVMIQKGLEDVKAYNWGVYSGKYRVLVNVPIALANAMCSSIVPLLTGLMVREEYHQVREKIGQGMRFNMLVAIPSAVGLAVLARPVITLLFSGEIDMAVNLLHIGTVSVVFYTMSTYTNGVLQGINKMRLPVRNSCIALVIHIIFLYASLQMDMGIQAAVYANILFAFVMCVLNQACIFKYIHYRQEYVRTFAIPLAASVVMGVAVGIVYWLLNMALSGAGDRVRSFVIVMAGIMVGVIVYFVALILLKGISEDDLKKMPGGRTVLGVAKRFRMM